ncbi:MAG: hypothetical protein QM564_09075 [Bergeyella sp.]
MKRKLFLLFLPLFFLQSKASDAPVRPVSKEIEVLIYKKKQYEKYVGGGSTP